VAEAPVIRYRHVRLRHAAAITCCGDASATIAACLAHRHGLALVPDLGGWAGRIHGGGDLLTLALRAARPAAAALRPGDDLPVLAAGISKGDTGRLLPYGAEPTALPLAQIGAFAARLAAALGIPLYLGTTPIAACSTGLYALLEAADLLETGRATRGLVAVADASLQPLILAGFRALGVVARTQPVAFTGEATGFAPAEGAAAVTLDHEDGVWELVGGVRLGDARHPTRCDDPAALRACLAALWRVLPAPEVIVAHATGTRAGDAWELAGLDDGPWHRIPRLVMKPLLGHCLGASGLVELASALQGPWRSLWKLSFGFGGHIAAVALRRE
jgi:3-oxoacyl-(acyl-carrier-protein) synthase